MNMYLRLQYSDYPDMSNNMIFDAIKQMFPRDLYWLRCVTFGESDISVELQLSPNSKEAQLLVRANEVKRIVHG